MNNYPIVGKNPEGKEEVVWKDRSCVVTTFVFGRDANGVMHVLATKRGTANYHVGKWNCQAGFIDFDETDKEAAIRETFEETSLVLDPKYLKYYNYSTKPNTNSNQVIVFRWTALLPETIDKYKISIENCEPNECTEVKWIDINKINDYKWACDHNTIINKIAKRRKYFEILKK